MHLHISKHTPVDQSQDVEHGGYIGMVVSRGFLQVLQSLFAERHGHLVAALSSVLDHQVMEGPEAGWDLIPTLLSGSKRGAVVQVWN